MTNKDCPEWLKPIGDDVKLEYNLIWQVYYDEKAEASRRLHDALNALYLEHYPEGDE